MNNKELYKLLQTVQKNIRCPQCGKEYSFSQIKIRGIVDKIVFLELVCLDHMPVMATVTLAGSNKSEKITTDEKVTLNDVLEAHNLINEFKGDFQKLFDKSVDR